MIIIQAVIPDYRVSFFKLINNSFDVKFITGDCYFTESVITSKNISDLKYVVVSKNIFFLKRKFLLQTWRGYLKDLFLDDIRVVELNPRCITSWISLIISFFFNIGKTITWGHLYNRQGDISKYSLRMVMMKLSNGVLFYTKGQENDFKKFEVSRVISGYAPNAIVHRSNIVYFEDIGKDFIYVGRLVADKKPLFLVEAFIRACEQGLIESNLHIVGDGEQFSILRSKIDESDYKDRIYLYGHNNDYEFLKDLYKKSISSISPGYVGLSITQSLSFGRPIIISKDEPHAPEIEMFSPSENGVFFNSDSIEDLSKKLIDFYERRYLWSSRSKKMASIVYDKYTYESMAEGFTDLVRRVK